jgi:hypothetical protein
MGDETKPVSADEFIKSIRGGKAETQQTPITAENFRSILKNAPPPEGKAWSDVATQAYTNAPQSALNFAKGLYESITNPKQTLSSISDLMQAGLSKVIPESMIDPNAQPAIGRGKIAGEAMAEHFKERYGSAEGFKEALSKDPVGVASDISTVLSAGSMGAGTIAKISEKAGYRVPQIVATEKALETAAKYTNPLTAVTATAGLVGKPVLGLSTGTGSENIANAAKSGFQGDKSFVENLRGEVPMSKALDDAKHNLSVMRQNRNNAYRSGMVDISNDKNILSFDDIDKAVEKAKKEVVRGTIVKDEKAFEHLNKIEEKIKEFKDASPDTYHTPEGLDDLKQAIGNINQTLPFELTNANRVASDIYNSVKGTIVKQAPKYSEVMKDYAESSDQLSQIERGLSLGQRASVDTALRKLQSLTRNNVNTNYGNRLDLAKQLEAEGGRPFINALSGQALSSPTARGLAGGVEGMTALGAFANPYTLAAIPFQTPRLVGEGLYAGGRAAKGLSNIADVTGLNPRNANALADLLYTDQQTNPNRIELSNMLPSRP